MHDGKNSLLSTLIFSFTIVSIVIPVLARQTRAQDSWLDRPLLNWNPPAGRLPQGASRSAAPAEGANMNRCRRQLRRPSSSGDKVLDRQGWLLYGPVYRYDSTTVITALASFDGMCRPLRFQAFVFLEGKLAGTLSPVLMNSRTDGSLNHIRLRSASSISADFARYKESDPLCCPSRISSVTYSLRRKDNPALTPRNVMHRPTHETNEPTSSGPNDEAASLFGKVWTFTQLEQRRLNAGRTYIEFARDEKRVSGSGGCNRFFGTFEIDGSMLKLSGIGSTKRACLDAELQRVETDFLKLLQTTTRFEVQGNTLRLYANDRLILVFASR